MRVHKQSSSAWIFLLTLLTCVFVISHVPCSQASSIPNLYLDPPVVMVDLGESFSINASIANVTDLSGWEFKLYYRNNILAIMTAVEGPFLKQGGSTAFFTVELNNNYNTTHGRIWLTCVLLGSVPGVNGNGTLATINFQAVGGGNTTLHLTDTVLGDSQANPIQHTTTDGTVQVTPPVTITNITPFATIAAQGIPFPINVTTLNESNDPATFNLTIYYNSTQIETKQITQPKQTNLTTTFMWDTTGLTRYQNYTISASTIHGTFIDGTITIVIPGDVDADKDVDLYDAVKLLKVYGAKAGNPRYDPNCDIDCDGSIILYDAVRLLTHYGQKEL